MNKTEAQRLRRRSDLPYYNRIAAKHNRLRLSRIKVVLRAYKEEVGCVDCKGRFPHYILELDHGGDGVRRRKNGDRSPVSSWNNPIYDLENTEVVCANCHRTRTHTRGELVR